VEWWQFSLLGAAGGAVVELLVVFQGMIQWQTARRTPTGRVRRNPPPLRLFLDVPAHAWVFPLRALLGAGGAALFGASGQITGVVAAVALGYAAPSVLGQLGDIRQAHARLGGAPAGIDTMAVGNAGLADRAAAEAPGSTSGR
jgi:hypothetical protein